MRPWYETRQLSGHWRRGQCTVCVAPSPVCSLWSIYLTIFVATCRQPVFLHSVASNGMVNQVFSCAEACWVHPHTTTATNTPWWLHPLLLCHSQSLVFQTWQLAGTSRQPSNKLMSKIWVHSEHTVEPGSVTLLPVQITLISLVWCGKAHVRTKKGARGARHAKLCCGWWKCDATSPGDKPFYVIVVWCH